MGILKIDEALEADARAAAAVNGGTVEQQIERWARQGRQLELERGPKMAAPPPAESMPQQIRSLLQRLTQPEDRASLRELIFASGKPAPGFDPAFPDLIVMVSPDGSRQYGRMEGREFKAVPDPRGLSAEAK